MWWLGNPQLGVKKWGHNQHTSHGTPREAKLGLELLQMLSTSKLREKKTNFYFFFPEMDEILVLLKWKAKLSI